MTMQHISTPAGRVASLAAHRRLSEREIAEAMGRDFDAAVRSAPTFPRGRRKSAGLSLFLAGAVVALAVSWGCAAVIWGVV